MRPWTVGATLLAALPHAVASPLPEDPVGRRAIRGTPIDVAQESDELRRLRRFEEELFPRAPLFAPPEGGASSEPAAHEGAAPAAAPPRPTAENPPEPLRSPSAAPATDGEPTPALPWLAGVKLPDLPIRWDPRLVRYLEFYKDDRRGRAIMSSWLRRQGRFRPLIDEALRRYRLPAALLYVSMIESGYDPLDKSSAGAAGLWQFMPEGGRIYGLRIDHWVDERRNPEKSTEAVMHYLGDLQARFGSWHLALAAFNAGYGAVLRAVAKYNTNDYWELTRHEDGLPWETTLYVPKALAAAVVGENRELFGYNDVKPDPAYEFDRVSVPSSTSLAAMAHACDATVEKIQSLNPELRRNRTPPEPWEARVPHGTGARFAASFTANREKIATHVVRFGERLDDIARAAGATARELRKLNGIDDITDVRPGLTMVIPEGRAPLPLPPEEEVAIVAVPDKSLAIAGKRRVFYRALPGDTVHDIAAFFRLPPGDLARWNTLDGDARLTSKMVLQLFVPTDFDASRVALLDAARVKLVTTGSDEFFELVEARNGRKRVTYVAKAGDTLKKIGAHHKLTEGDLERINRFGRHTDLKVGQKITLYVPMSAAERAASEKSLLASVREPAPEPVDVPVPVPVAVPVRVPVPVPDAVPVEEPGKAEKPSEVGDGDDDDAPPQKRPPPPAP